MSTFQQKHGRPRPEKKVGMDQAYLKKYGTFAVYRVEDKEEDLVAWVAESWKDAEWCDTFQEAVDYAQKHTHK